MKVLDFHELKTEDRLWFEFKGVFDPQAARESALEPFFQALERYADGWMPDVAEGKRRRKYARAAIWKALEEERDGHRTALGLYRTKWPASDMTLRLCLPPALPSWTSQSTSSRSPSSRRRNTAATSWRWCVPGPLACGRDKEIAYRDGFDKIYEVCWLNVFGPKLVETVGRERMLSTPAWKVEELPNGSILLVTWPTVADFASKEARLAQARAHIHLRPDLDFDAVLRTLLERSDTLAPVEPRFHPDVAPLLSRVVDRIASRERPRKIAELNAWQPPEPEEWRPAGSALPVDVEDPERALEHYSYLAELLVALLHTAAPSVFDATPESLTDADFYFWREEFPTSRLREAIDERAVPAIGAYLGEVLVRNLGGQWIPRKNLMEAQVLVGNRVWLPFVRAQHYMRSRQALLDHSLTQLYRVAERHRS